MTTRRISITFLANGFSDALNGQAAAVANWLRTAPDTATRVGDEFPNWWQAAQLALDATPTGERVAHSGGDTSNIVLSAVMGRQRAVGHAEDVLAHLTEAHTHLAAAYRLMAANTRRVNSVELAQVKEATRCAGMSLQGYQAWGDPLCSKPRASASYPQHFQSGEYPVELCLDCITHWRRWGADPGYVREHKTDGRRGARPSKALEAAFGVANAENMFRAAERIVERGHPPRLHPFPG